MKVHVQTEVNGEAVEFLCDPTTTLLEVLPISWFYLLCRICGWDFK